MTLGLAALGAGVVVGCCSVCAPKEYAPSIDEGFVSLFNGRDLTGWTGSVQYGVETNEVKLNSRKVVCQPALVCQPERKVAGDAGNLVSDREYGNFILRFEFQLPENGRGGLGVRMLSAKADAASEGMCEIPLLAGGKHVRKPGVWNFAEVKVIGSEIEVYVNGYLVQQGDGDTPDGKGRPGLHNKTGRIGWCGHGTAFKLKNIRVKELPGDAKMGACPCQREACPDGFTAYFDGCPEQLKTMWKGVTTAEGFDNPIKRQNASPEKRAEMQKRADEQRDAHWHVRNGNLFFDAFRQGYSLATCKDLKDFEMWADWRILSIRGDSGLYLRGSPQVQIWDAHNQWGIGSGGLYNNQKGPSRALKIADRQVGDWNRFHVIMRGDKVTVWLNGELVVDNVTLENYWDRKQPIFPVEQLELQCHGDPTEWRNIFIKEL